MTATTSEAKADSRIAATILDRLIETKDEPFALVCRPETAGPHQLELFLGSLNSVENLADISALYSDRRTAGTHHQALVMVPFRQVAERGFAHHDDQEQILVLTIEDQRQIPLDEVLDHLNSVDEGMALSGGTFDVDDDSYAKIVEQVINDEIGQGAGANFVIKRSFVAQIENYDLRQAISLFGRLLEQEIGAYWTFIVHTGSRTFVGATPEQHLRLTGGVAEMNPISGTYRYPSSGPNLEGVLDFVADAKEADELFMVVDEELKLMAEICDQGAYLVGPNLKEMTRLAHTEYHLQGRTSRSPINILRSSLLAPTVTGSPLANACRVIQKYEPRGRGFYSGVVALISRDGADDAVLDSAILIRTAEISAHGRINIGVGATLVRHSRAWTEVAETHTKTAAILRATQAGGSARLRGAASPVFANHPVVQDLLATRNNHLASFWLAPPSVRKSKGEAEATRSALVIDAEDSFSAMLAEHLCALGLTVETRSYKDFVSTVGFDLVVVGPGPGDPTDNGDSKINRLRMITRRLLSSGQPFLAVCLGHQILASVLGIPIVRLELTNQGTQKTVHLFGQPLSSRVLQHLRGERRC